jgi:hypothetical protein
MGRSGSANRGFPLTPWDHSIAQGGASPLLRRRMRK